MQRTGTLPIDQIKEGMFLEAQHDIEPDLVWPVKVIENVGGRLLLRYEAAETAAGDFWLFYLHHRLHPIGWARSHDCTYHPPAGLSARKLLRNYIVREYVFYVFFLKIQKRDFTFLEVAFQKKNVKSNQKIPSSRIMTADFSLNGISSAALKQLHIRTTLI